VSLAELSSSIIVRSEHQYNREERWRLSLRKHLYELHENKPHVVNGSSAQHSLTGGVITALRHRNVTPLVVEKLSPLVDKEPMDQNSFQLALREVLSEDELAKHQSMILQYSSSAMRCHPIEGTDRFDRYLGFLDMRPNSMRSPLAMALLAPPRRFVHDRDCFVITGEYGPLFGATGFPCSVYSMHDPDTGGARCGQASVIMALGALADRGAGFLGSYTLTYLAKAQKAAPFTPPPSNPDCLAREVVAEADPPRGFEIGGLKPEEMCDLLKNRNVSPSLIVVPSRGKRQRSDYLAFRLIEAYVRARFPVIMAVNCVKWWWWRPRDEPHAVIVIGVRGSSSNPGDNSLIVHDPGYIPFLERPVGECLLAAYAYDKKDSVWMVAVADHDISRHAFDCITSLDRAMAGRFYDEFSPESPEEHRGYRIDLVLRDDLIPHIFRSNEFPDGRARFAQLRREIESRLPRVRFWCISAVTAKGNRWVWLFDATGSPRTAEGWSAMIQLAPSRPVGVVTFANQSGTEPTNLAFSCEEPS
jgi:hypothetical protein